MSFGETLLKKSGWREGKGLGAQETGIKTYLRPKLKFNTCGFGFDPSIHFTTRWWDDVYNKSAKAISVEQNENGEVYLSKAEDKKSPKNIQPDKKKNHYSNFIKASVLEGLNEIPQNDNLITKEEVESHKLVKRLDNEELFNYCGQLTAHKGARHGLTMSAKLVRLQQQEASFLNSKKDLSALDCQTRDTKKEKKLKDGGNKEMSSNLNFVLEDDNKKKRVREVYNHHNAERSEKSHIKRHCGRNVQVK